MNKLSAATLRGQERSLTKSERNSKRARRIIMWTPIVFLALFYILPISIMFVSSFWKIGGSGELVHEWSLRQYITTFSNPVYMKLLLKSFGLALLNTGISLVIAYPFAFFIAKIAKPKWRYLLLFLIILPSWTSFLIRAYSWILILGEHGLINSFLMSIGVISTPLSLVFNSTSVLIALVHIYMPFMLLPIFASLEKVDFSLVDAAESLGASKLTVFLRIILPLSLPGILSGVIIVLIPSIGEYVIPMVLGGNSGMMYANAVASQFTIMNWPFGAALAFVLFIVVMVIFSLYSKFMKIEDIWSGL